MAKPTKPGKIKTMMLKLRDNYILSYLKAPSRKEYVFGQRLPNKWDVKKEYTANMKELLAIAKSDPTQADAVEFATGVINSQVDELKQLLADLEDTGV